MKKVSITTMKSILDEQKELLVRYSNDKVAKKEIKADIASIEAVIVLLSVRDLMEYDLVK